MGRIGIIGAGPAGSMQAVMLATLFPLDHIYVFDKNHAYIRGHGLKIRPETIRFLIEELTNQQKKIVRILNGLPLQNISAPKMNYYRAISSNIQDTIQFLSTHFSSKSDVFMRTNALCDILQKHALDLSKKNAASIYKLYNQPGHVEFRMTDEIKEEDLKELKFSAFSGTDAAVNAKDTSLSILKKCQIVFGCDGSHSKVRKVIFADDGALIDASDLSHLVEIKLDMQTASSKIKDTLQRSIIPSLKMGTVHFWNQSKDDTATLNIFITKAIYDDLRASDDPNKPNATHANPYRRLIDLPVHLQSAGEKEISEVIGLGSFKPETLKITAIPLYVYRAKKYHTIYNHRQFVLAGDSATGLVLENGVNMAFKTNLRQALAFCRESPTTKALDQTEKEINQDYDRYIRDINSKFKLIESYGDSYHAAKLHAGPRLVTREPIMPSHPAYERLLQRLPRFPVELNNEDSSKRCALHADVCFYMDRLLISMRLWLQQNAKGNKKLNAKVNQFIEDTQSFIDQMYYLENNLQAKRIKLKEYSGKVSALLFIYSLRKIYRDANDMVQAHRRLLDAMEATDRFNRAVAALPKEKFGELKEKLQLLQTAIVKEPTPNDKKHLAVLAHFANLAEKLSANKLDKIYLQKTLTSLDHALYGKPPLSKAVKMAIGVVIGALIGALLTFGILSLVAAPVSGIVAYTAFFGGVGGYLGAFPGGLFAKTKSEYLREREGIKSRFIDEKSIEGAQNMISKFV